MHKGEAVNYDSAFEMKSLPSEIEEFE